MFFFNLHIYNSSYVFQCSDEEVTPPTTIQKIIDNNSGPKLQSKRKNYVSRETMERQAGTAKSQKSLNYSS